MAIETKTAIKSLGVWGGIIAILPLIAEGATSIAGIPGIPPNVSVIVSAVGGVASIVGRIIATVRISGLF